MQKDSFLICPTSCDLHQGNTSNAFVSNIWFTMDTKTPKPELFQTHPKKPLTNVIKTVMTSSRFHCVFWCSVTDGCLPVNVIRNHDVTCQLTTCLSEENEMHDDYFSNLFVPRKKIVVANLQVVGMPSGKPSDSVPDQQTFHMRCPSILQGDGSCSNTR